ncbi:hypothetical protein [Neobacillus citreus]|uniref:Uncharacterized protein n=1 Tax=Neobacillus citreus TaxID=2833578 RepID=A0A942YDR9_9BACI|nr:hypothetical protein [Neobacillus citreus]MCH6266984.1 hypothetical protein [Neobacillus citreus]
MKVFFGSIEYFEQEFMIFAKKRRYIKISREQVMEIYSEIKDDLIFDFVCDDNIKKECLKNLNQASQRFLYSNETYAMSDSR